MSKIKQIIRAYIESEYPKDVQKKFGVWLGEKRNEKEKDEVLTEIWNELHVEADDSTEESFRNLQSRIHPKTAFFPVRRWVAVAAILLLPLLSVMFTYLYMTKDTVEDIQLVEYIVPNGETKDVVLPDSSKIRLNAGSILVYPQRFGKTRTVYLNGEAYFSVTKNDRQPFVVSTTDMEIEVLGTVFNVHSYPDSEKSSTTLECGKVNVHFKNGDNATVMLAPGERIMYNRISGITEKQTVKIENVIAWTKDKLIIQSLSMDEIAKIIERKYGMKVQLNSYRYRNERITMKLDSESDMEEFMDILLNIIPNLRYKIENDKLYIY